MLLSILNYVVLGADLTNPALLAPLATFVGGAAMAQVIVAVMGKPKQSAEVYNLITQANTIQIKSLLEQLAALEVQVKIFKQDNALLASDNIKHLARIKAQKAWITLAIARLKSSEAGKDWLENHKPPR